MTEIIKNIMTCPRCGNKYSEYPALSIVDNKTHLCPNCGIRETLDYIGLDPEKQEKVFEAIRRSDLPKPD